MVSIKLSVFVAFMAVVTLSTVEVRAGDCNMDKGEMAAKMKDMGDCYKEITGEELPKNHAEMAKIDKTVMVNTMVCAAQKDGTIEDDGKTINKDKIRELINSSNQSDEVKAALCEGMDECYDTKKEDLAAYFKCCKMVYMDVCM